MSAITVGVWAAGWAAGSTVGLWRLAVRRGRLSVDSDVQARLLARAKCSWCNLTYTCTTHGGQKPPFCFSPLAALFAAFGSWAALVAVLVAVVISDGMRRVQEHARIDSQRALEARRDIDAIIEEYKL